MKIHYKWLYFLFVNRAYMVLKTIISISQDLLLATGSDINLTKFILLWNTLFNDVDYWILILSLHKHVHNSVLIVNLYLINANTDQMKKETIWYGCQLILTSRVIWHWDLYFYILEFVFYQIRSLDFPLKIYLYFEM